MTAADIQKEFGKTFKSLNMKPYKVPARPRPLAVFLVKQTLAFKKEYPTLKIFSTMSHEVAINKCHEDSRLLFKSQPQFVMDGLTKASAGNNGEDGDSVMNLSQSIPSMDELIKRGERIQRKSSKRWGGNANFSKMKARSDLEIERLTAEGGGSQVEVRRHRSQE